MSITIRRFNELGIQQFDELLFKFRQLKAISDDELEKVAFSDASSSLVVDSTPLELPSSNNKLEIVQAIITALNLQNNEQLFNDRGLWTWLSALLLKRLSPPDKKTGEVRFNERALYVLETQEWKRYYRHLVAFPCVIQCTIGEGGRVFLRGDISERGEAVEQLSSVHDIQRNPGILEAATLLYYDDEKGDMRRGITSKDAGGSIRRFREVIKQFKVTYDLNAMSGQQIAKLLPSEFSKWKKGKLVQAKAT